ncbi:MAG: tryptophan synthase subunit alpha [Thermoplasmata archaeon]
MPNALARALRRSPQGAASRLVPYLMVDRRRQKRLTALVHAIRAAGADALELGFPFSDPIADGPQLQAVSERALHHGTHWSDLLSFLDVASPILPCAVMTYANPVYRRGVSTAIRELAHHGASGLILPDVAWEESREWREACRSFHLALVRMAAPGTSQERLTSLGRASEGFLYLVARLGTTGASGFQVTPELRSLVATSHRARPRLPVLIGFGIRGPMDARRARATGADGIIVGSAFESALGAHPTPARAHHFLDPLRAALDESPASVLERRVVD